MSFAVRFRMEPVRTRAYDTIDPVAYMSVGSPLDKPTRLIYVTNISDGTLAFSLNGIDDHFVLPSNGFILLDIAANKTQDSGFFLAQGEQLYVRSIIAPTIGAVYFSTVYGTEE